MSDRREHAEPGCDTVVELLAAYVRATLPPVRKEQVEAHLASCASCRTALEQSRLAAAISGHMVGEDVDVRDPEAREDFLSAFRSWATDDRAS